MDPRFQAGVELQLEKAASQVEQTTLSGVLRQKLADDNGVRQTRASVNTTSASGKGMETKNTGYGKAGDSGKLDDDPTEGSAQETGKVSETHSGKNVTSEAHGSPDLSIGNTHKTASDRRAQLTSIVRRAAG